MCCRLRIQRSNEAEITTPRDFFAQLIRGRSYTVRPFRQKVLPKRISKRQTVEIAGVGGVDFFNRMLLGLQRDYILILETYIARPF